MKPGRDDALRLGTLREISPPGTEAAAMPCNGPKPLPIGGHQKTGILNHTTVGPSWHVQSREQLPKDGLAITPIGDLKKRRLPVTGVPNSGQTGLHHRDLSFVFILVTVFIVVTATCGQVEEGVRVGGCFGFVVLIGGRQGEGLQPDDRGRNGRFRIHAE